MATPPVSNLSIFQEIQSFYQNRGADLRQLGSALQSGDLNTAQQAYNALASLGQGGPFANSEPFVRADRAKDFEAVGQALQSGDLAGAQAAFADLQHSFGSRNQSTSGLNSPAAVVTLSGGAQSNGAQPTAGIESIYQQLQQFRTERKATSGNSARISSRAIYKPPSRPTTLSSPWAKTAHSAIPNPSRDRTAPRISRPSARRFSPAISPARSRRSRLWPAPSAIKTTTAGRCRRSSSTCTKMPTPGRSDRRRWRLSPSDHPVCNLLRRCRPSPLLNPLDHPLCNHHPQSRLRRSRRSSSISVDRVPQLRRAAKVRNSW